MWLQTFSASHGHPESVLHWKRGCGCIEHAWQLMTKMADCLELRVGDRYFFCEFRRVFSIFGDIINQSNNNKLFRYL